MYKIELKFNNPTTKAISFECNDVELPKTLDKAKRNEHFREYLLTNFDEQEYGHDYY